MTELEDRLSRTLREDIPRPTRPLDPGAIRHAADRRRPAHTRVVLTTLGAAAVVVVAVGIPFGVHVARRDAAAPPAPSISRQDTRTAAGYSAALLTRLPLPSGARRVLSRPVSALPGTPVTAAGAADVALAWWTVPGTATGAGSTIGTATLPAHWTRTAEVFDTNDPSPRMVSFEVRDPGSAFVTSIVVSVAAGGSTSALAAQVTTYRLPVRTPIQVIPAGIDAATVALTGGGGRSYSSTLTVDLTARAASILIRQINATPTDVSLTAASCPGPLGTATVTFRAGARRWTLDLSAGSPLCNAPVLTDPAGGTLQLGNLSAVLRDVLDAAGLPATYFG